MANNNTITSKRELPEILANLRKPVAANLISSKSTYTKGQASGKAQYIAWPTLIRLLDERANGFWEWKIRTIIAGDRTIIEGSLTVHGSDGSLTREAAGNESNDVDSYGDPSSNAEAMALRRCCAKFGLGLELWDKTKPSNGGLTREEWQAKFANK